jgi:hypothetical protein
MGEPSFIWECSKNIIPWVCEKSKTAGAEKWVHKIGFGGYNEEDN